MTDLTDLKTPFGLLDRATQEALMAHGGPWEYWNGGSWTNSASETLHDIDTALTYRAKPAPPKPPVEVIKPSDADVKAVAERCGRSSDTYRTRIIMSTFLAMKAEGLL